MSRINQSVPGLTADLYSMTLLRGRYGLVVSEPTELAQSGYVGRAQVDKDRERWRDPAQFANRNVFQCPITATATDYRLDVH